jgi:uncharacterized iron-regulated membrane protein
VLVFYGEIDRALNPDLHRIAEPGAPLPLDALVAAAEAVHPGTYVAYIDLPDDPGGTALCALVPHPGSDVALPEGLQTFLDPTTGALLGERSFGAFRLDRRHFAPFLYQLHMDLHLGRAMVWLLGAVALLWALDHAIALYLSFPAPARWRESLRIPVAARRSAFVYLLHRAIGLWLLPVTLTLAVTGLYFNWYETFRATVARFSPLTESPAVVGESATAPSSDDRIGLDRAVAIALGRAPGRSVDGLSIDPAGGLYSVRVFDPLDVANYGERTITIGSASGEILADLHPARGSAGDRFLEWQYPLHSGKAFGWPGRILIFIAGLVVAALSLTGFILWWRKLRGRRRLARGRDELLANLSAESA